MKKIISVLLFLFAIITLTLSQKVVKVGAFNYYPGIFKDADGQIKGFYVDALNDLGRKENINFVYIYGSWNDGLKRIKTGEVDLLTSVAITEDRLKFMDFSDIPLLTVWSEVYIKSKSEIKGILDLKQKSIAVMKGDYNALFFKQFAEKLAVTCNFVETTDFDEVFKLTIDGKVDAGIVNNTFGAAKSKEYGLISSGIVFNPFDIYFAVKKGSNANLLSMLNTSLHSWKHDKNSVFNSSRQKWSHGNVGVIEVFPKWVQKAVYITLFSGLLFIVFIVLLRYKIKHETKKLHESENTFRKLFDESSDANLLLDRTGIFVECNQSALDLLKMERAHLLFKPLNCILPKYQADGLNSEEKAHKMIEVAYEKGLHRFDWTCITSEGEEFIADVSLMPISIRGELMLYTTWKDITQRKKIEKELILAKEKAEESDRLKTAFLQNMSHEIRTPMNAIMGFSSLMSANSNNSQKLEQFSKIIEQRCNDLLSIINDILDISRIESGQTPLHIEVCHLNKLFSELALFFSDYQNKTQKTHIKLTFNKIKDRDIEIIHTDSLKLKQVLINLITNAFKYSEEGHIECSCRLENNQLLFSISDTGIGIPEDKHACIFERFTQLKNSMSQNSGGTGLGLPIVKGLVELLGGKVWLKSECDKGTTFFFTIDYIKPTSTNKPNISATNQTLDNDMDNTELIVEDAKYKTKS